MLETSAVVIGVEGRHALVESAGGGCGKCDSVNGCGSSKLSQLFCSKPRIFRVRNEANAPVGATVQVVVEEGVLLRSALLMYLLPLVLLFAGAIFGSLWVAEENQDIYSALGALGGLISGYVLVKYLSGRNSQHSVAQAVILSANEVAPEMRN